MLHSAMEFVFTGAGTDSDGVSPPSAASRLILGKSFSAFSSLFYCEESTV